MVKKFKSKDGTEEKGKEGQGKEAQGKGEKGQEKQSRRPKQIMRFVETNVDGSLKVEHALRSVMGSGFMLSTAIAKVSGFYGQRLGEIGEAGIKKLESIIADPQKSGIPSWMLNRRRDPVTGLDRHIMASQLDFSKKMDINELKKMRSYKGVRHGLGLPVRGQRTRSSFRKSGKVVGVSKKKPVPKAGEKPKAEKK